MDDSRFGPYLIGEVIGRGGMGVVHRAVDTRKNRTVALKLLPPEVAADDEFRARFRLEAEAAGKLSDPHVVPIHDFGEIDGRFFIDMRLVDGIDLAALLRRDGPLPPRRAAGIITQVAAALDSAHRAGLVHRDVKPTNILVSEGSTEDFAYLIDFGIVRSGSGSRITAAGRAVGTFDYMAPERFLRAGADDPGVDVYALGCVLHEVLTGQPPFGHTDPAVSMYSHLNVPPPRPSAFRGDISPAFDAVVARALAKDPAARFADVLGLAGAARAAAVERPVFRIPGPGPGLVAPPGPPRPGPAVPPAPPPPRPEAVTGSAFRAADRAAVVLTALYLAIGVLVPAPAVVIPVAVVVVANVAGAVLLGLGRSGLGGSRAAAVHTGLVGGLAVNSALVLGLGGYPAAFVPIAIVLAGLAWAAAVRTSTRDPARRARSLDGALVGTALAAVVLQAVWSVRTVVVNADTFLATVISATAVGGLLLLAVTLTLRARRGDDRLFGGVLAVTASALGFQLVWRGIYWGFSPVLRPFLAMPSRIVFLAGTVVCVVLLLGYLVLLVRGFRRSAPR